MKFKAAPDDEVQAIYKRYRNLYNMMKQLSKEMYFVNKLQEYEKDIKLTWKSIRLLLGKMHDKSEICTTFRINNTHTSDVEKIANAFL